MKTIFLILALILPNLAFAEDLQNKFVSATGVLHMVSKKDASTSLCTTVAFSKKEKTYQFFTAAHCVADFKRETSESILTQKTLHIILENKTGGFIVTEAKVLTFGQMKDFNDFAILEAEFDGDIPIVPLSKDDPELDEDVRIVSAPLGAGVGTLLIRGYVSKEKMLNMIMFANVDIKNAIALQFIGLGSASGSSGGGVWSIRRGAIVGILVGSIASNIGHVSLVAVPISKFNNFYIEYLQGKHPLPLSKQENKENKQNEDLKKHNPKKG